MQQFIPFEDDWDALENLRPEDLIPYRVGLQLSRDPMPGVSVPTLHAPIDARSGRPSGQLVRAGGSGG
ncbi:MAG TPA: hypothetical protein VN043_12585 [Rhodanobacter sp.]|nr:hypothetical protein [Rhodanobacter sp.]